MNNGDGLKQYRHNGLGIIYGQVTPGQTSRGDSVVSAGSPDTQPVNGGGAIRPVVSQPIETTMPVVPQIITTQPVSGAVPVLVPAPQSSLPGFLQGSITVPILNIQIPTILAAVVVIGAIIYFVSKDSK
jgi:hypothetical protein